MKNETGVVLVLILTDVFLLGVLSTVILLCIVLGVEFSQHSFELLFSLKNYPIIMPDIQFIAKTPPQETFLFCSNLKIRFILTIDIINSV